MNNFNFSKLIYLRFFAAIFYFFVDTFFIILFYFYVRNEKNDKTKIVFMRIDNLGDYVLWSRLISNLRYAFPKKKYHLTLICNSAFFELARSSNNFDEVIPFSRNKFVNSLMYRFFFGLKVANSNFNVAINPIFSREAFYSDPLVRFTFAKTKIGMIGSTSNSTIFIDSLYNKIYSKIIIINDVNSEFSVNKFFLNSIGIRTNIISKNFSYFLNPNSQPFLIEQNYFVIAPGASSPLRRWPAINFAKILDFISRKYGLVGVICGTDADIEIANSILEKSVFKPINLVGKTSLLNFFNVIKFSRIVISNETGATQISEAFNVPTVCILGGGHHNRFTNFTKSNLASNFINSTYPMSCFGCDWKCIYKSKNQHSYPCIENISISKVQYDVESLLDDFQTN